MTRRRSGSALKSCVLVIESKVFSAISQFLPPGFAIYPTRIALVLEESETERTQAFVLRWRVIVSRNCAPAMEFQSRNSIREVEDDRVELSGVTVLELVIVPDISRGSAHASLKCLRLS
jgi:hypothetical protein